MYVDLLEKVVDIMYLQDLEYFYVISANSTIIVSYTKSYGIDI